VYYVKVRDKTKYFTHDEGRFVFRLELNFIFKIKETKVFLYECLNVNAFYLISIVIIADKIH